MAQVADSDWIEWAGGECPVSPYSIVELKYRDDADPDKGERIAWPTAAGILAWYHDGQDDDIIAYRVVSA